MTQLPIEPGDGLVQCDVTGQFIPADEAVVFHGRRVGVEGKQILLDRLKAGEALPGELETAGVMRRIGCAILDSIIIGIVIFAIGMGIGYAMAGMATTVEGAALIESVATLAGVVVSMLYFTLMHASSGQTLGKKAGSIKVTQQDGSPITMTQSFWRAMLYTGVQAVPALAGLLVLISVDLLVVSEITTVAMAVFVLANIIVMLVAKQHRALHDQITGTRVIALD